MKSVEEELTCMQESDECKGDVSYFAVSGGNAFPRCAHHIDLRMDAYESSDLERYADSDVAPSWFDPADAGERWDDDY